MATGRAHQNPIVLVIDFHHARGPEIEHCFGDDGTNPAVENDWSLLPFMALSDGAHASTEDFSYFTLRRNATDAEPATSLFGISCTRQLDSNSLINRPPDVTRSTVQKAVVVVTDSPQYFGQLREKLSIVTSAWFAQRDFTDTDILKKFREGLIISLNNEGTQKDQQQLGLSLREMIHEFRHQTLVLFKCLLLQPKMLFFGSRCERLCMIQFSLISLIPGLIHNLQDCADPSFDTYSQTVEKPTSLKTSERSSLLAYMGLPLQIFGKGSMFGPYTPLQQLDLLADHGTKSYVVGSTNSLLLQQKDRYSDVIINLDEDTINISSPSLRNALSLSAADRRWIDFLTQTINETWDEAHPQQPKTHGYMGSEEFIRLQFEEYLLALLSSMKYHEELSSYTPGSGNDSGRRNRMQLQALNIEGDPALEFNADFLAQWQTTPNYALFKRLTSDALLFSIVEPRHPCAGGLTIDDIQRRLSQQVAELHLDERVREGREALNKHLATGSKKVSAAFNSFWADIESMREAQRKKNEEKAGQSGNRLSIDTSVPPTPTSPRVPSSAASETRPSSWFSRRPPSVDLTQAQASVGVVSQKAGAYFSSWSSWASERRKEWQDKRASATSPPPIASPSTTTLASVVEKPEDERGRQEAVPRTSEDSIALSRSGSMSLSRSGSRRKRWSQMLRRKSNDSDSASMKDDGSLEPGSNDVPLPKSPLSQTMPVFPDSTGSEESSLKEQSSKEADRAAAEAKLTASSPSTENKASESIPNEAPSSAKAPTEPPSTTSAPASSETELQTTTQPLQNESSTSTETTS
ncbi:hypothetical protein DTO027B5_8491 [Paecilomyces variotii]|nr:hypothetical protein DTO195F2_2748 [Paecilomyces variotii]KAJ9320908.1 hypothetical protein DTO027B3_8070 [Paecilomyces variotii]KAJ9328977.1 hypothetical protein DTO027B5_8491 [Paecilomyces variotii]KAJ9366435.1 hypothetical protein DTO282E5_8903 [Paecilomyces variotii]KAJ9394539.1 hypothetical protein DTO282F9_8528 [Paecilomyces variotii]